MAATTTEYRRDLSAPESGGIWMSTEPNLKGLKNYTTFPLNTCINLSEPWFAAISSLRPDTGVAVTLSRRNYCDNPTDAIFWPGIDDLRDYGWDHRIASFLVHKVQVEDNGWNCIREMFAGVQCSRCCNGCSDSGENVCAED
ncbi:hypothetical protein EJ05DRAFT_474172 [Pseudovirgaria hyperparasitica]|uniref:Uncharacterized protein n=1 Tax=Pseudovirgaria hyperparasitica TaxID=470096 RepID=A0A6A6WBS6_9PEZI|nr:uncharacterized protein EJ05DRAFT_474172 [Pseudovirgaria hyperparasitica]KAF2760282.1 hypothetical protein EJ05DRAFT_474172 [Pseudovirgaria hyperparasitica]